LVSHYMHEQFEWRMRMPIEEAVNTHPELVSYGCYGRQLEPFLEAYGAENILLIFFERFIREGPSELSRVCRFLGSASEPRWVDSLSLTNVSNERMRDSPLRDRIVNAPVLRTIRRRLIPQSWRNRVKRFWQIRERPQLSPATIHRLEDTFDADLATLGSWLNLDLSCRRFREVARSTVPEWTGKANPLGERILANSTTTSSCVPSSHE
ncbi:MAG: sulfotransferase domain-containing protein, partial [Isosphaeraceae bacterium]